MSLLQKWEEFVNPQTFPSFAHATAFQFFQSLVLTEISSEQWTLTLHRQTFEDDSLCFLMYDEDKQSQYKKLLKAFRKLCFEPTISIECLQMAILFLTTELYKEPDMPTKLQNKISNWAYDITNHPIMQTNL